MRRCFINFVLIFAGCGISASGSSELIAVLESTLSQDEAKSFLEPHLVDLKSLEPKVVEKVILRGWWELAREIVAKSHIQKVDLSVPVRKAGKTMKDEADELMRTLNPKYGDALQVSPAFQWAQNDTCVFITAKFTARWNAPGALEVTEPSVVMANNIFNFTGLGKHSNNKYKYTLDLSLFDNILPSASAWSAASVGKLSVTLKKKWPRKWPRLLANKKQKIQNMHMWMDRQEELDSSLGGLTAAAHSPITCTALEKLYCLVTDTCKKTEECSQCPGKAIPSEDEHICTGMPTEKASLNFKDSDMDQNEIGGDVKITKAKNEFDIAKYVVYFGKDDKSKLELEEGKPLFVGEVAPTGSAEVFVPVALNTPIPEAATHLLVFSQNDHGEYGTPGSTLISDAVLPKHKPKGLSFDDQDGEVNELRGTITVERSEDESHIEEYSVHWGRTATRKISNGSLVSNIKNPKPKEGTPPTDPTYYVSTNTKIPDTAHYLLVFSKNSHGENPQPASLKIVDKTKPCLKDADDDCVASVTATVDQNPAPLKAQAVVSVQRARNEESVTSYALFWGRKNCDDGGQSGAKNSLLKDLPVEGSLEFEMPANQRVPAGTTHILAFSKNKLGESEHCVSVVFEDNSADDPKLEEGLEKKDEL